MKVAGIDFSSNAIDVVLVDLDDLEPPEWVRWELEGADAFERTRAVGQSPIAGSGFWEDTLAIGIEHPAGKFGVGAMMRVQGAVLACLPSGVLVQPWPPAAWRKAVGLAGNATKLGVSEWANNDRLFAGVGLMAVDWPQDACDAYCIALATRNALERQAA